jgi:hypothetical protein
LLNGRILGGIACYVAVMVLFVAVFTRGGELTVLYPVYAATFGRGGGWSAAGSRCGTG